MPDYRWRWNNYQHPALVAAFDMSTRTPGGLMKNLAKTGSVYDATINGTLVLANPLIKCKSTKCMDFDGATNYLSLANPLSGLSGFTILCWVNYDTKGRMIWCRATLGDTYIWSTNSVPELALQGNYITGPNRFTTGTTHMMVGTRDATTTMTSVYIDNILLGKRLVGAIQPVEANCYIGKYWNLTLYMDGRIDNVMFFNVGLTPDQINSIYRSANPRL